MSLGVRLGVRPGARGAGEPIRVAHLINHLGYGGSERQLYLLLEHMDAERFAHRVVVFNPSPERVYDEALAELGVEVGSLPGDCRGVARRLLYLGRELRRWRPDVVHSWSVHDNPYAGLAGRFAGARARWGSLRGSVHSPGLSGLPRPARWMMLRSVDRVVVNSRALVEELAAAGVPRRRTLLLPNCVRAPTHEDEIADLGELGIGPQAPVVGIVGNLRPVKNHLLFIRAMARVISSRPAVRGVIVGQPIPGEEGYLASLEGEIGRLDLEGKVVLAGFRDDVPRILRRLAVLCLTSRSEGMPNALLEGMVAGCPVVATGVGGVPELVGDGVHGFVVAPGDEEGLTKAVGRLLDDPELARALGQAGRERATGELGCERAAARLGEAYAEAVGRGTG